MSREKIVNALRLSVAGARKMGLYPGKSGIWETMEQAADLIENQQNHIAALRKEIERARMLSEIQRCATCDYWQESDPRCMCGCSQYGGKTVSRDNYCGNWTRHIDWLAVAERLPEPTVCVLVAYSDGTMEVDAWGHDGWMGEDLSNGTITHWMPLPSAPEEGYG